MIMNKLMSKATLVVATIGLVAVSAHAGPRGDEDRGQRDVIGDAQALCKTPFSDPKDIDEEIFNLACKVLHMTNGEQIQGKACVADASDTNGYVTYTGRNCDKNEVALERKVSSVVLSMDDVIARDKTRQVLTAAEYACEYASKATFLEDVEKLDLHDNDLIGDAESIAKDLGYPCES